MIPNLLPAQLGVGVSLICSDQEFLPCLESELRASLKKRMQRNVLFVDESIKNIELALDSNAVRVTLEARTPSQNAQSNSAAPSQNSQSKPAVPSLLSSLTNMMNKGTSANKLPRPARVLKVYYTSYQHTLEAHPMYPAVITHIILISPCSE